MYERCLNEAERILAADRDVIVPVKKVWKEVGNQGKGQGFAVPSLGDFSVMLEADVRFEFVSSHDEGEMVFEDQANDNPIEEAELESLGFFSGDRVKLRHIELTPELIGTMIRRKVDMTMDALTKAWELRPDGDQDAEDQLLDILAKTQKLQREVKKTFSEERMKKLEQALEEPVSPNEKKKPRRPAARKRVAPKSKRTTPAKPRAKKPAAKTRSQRGRRK